MAKQQKTLRKQRFYSKAEARVLAVGKGAKLLLLLLSRAKENEELSVIPSDPAVQIMLNKYKI